MIGSFGRRLELVTALEIAAVLWLVVFAIALLGFGAYASSVKADVAATLSRAVATASSSSVPTATSVAGSIASSNEVRGGVYVLVFDSRDRYDVYRDERGDARATVHLRERGAPPPSTIGAGPSAAPIVGLATAFGVMPQHAQIGDVQLLARESDAAIVAVVRPFVLPLLAVLLFVTVVAFLVARALTRQVLRPLVEVQRALERFASGDLRPQPIAADRRSSLGGLAVAYNGAIAQMESAFAERERANTSMRQFIADAGHQLRTPLTVVRGFIAILRKGDLRSPEDRDRILTTMHRQSALMGSLVDKLMLLERWEGAGDHAETEPIDVARLVEDVVSPLAEANPQRDVRIEAPSAELAAIDPIDLSHAVTNIVDNALKYTTGRINTTVARSAEAVIVTIADAGPGMAPSEVHHAFDRFFRGSRRDIDGTGLGLAIAKRAVERAGGTLTLQSSIDTGSTFTIKLPAANVQR